jgi:hypothetical protein
VRGDKNIVKMSEQFVLLRLTYMRGVNIGLFAYDYDMTWMSFFLDAEGRIYSRYGSRDSTSPDSHNSAAGLIHTMEEVLRVHKEETAKERPAYQLPPALRPEDLPAMRALGYAGSCGRCHMLNESLATQQRKDGKKGASWFYPLPDTIGIKLDRTKGNEVVEIAAGSFADKAGLKAGDVLRSANETRLITIADFQSVLNGLEPRSRLTLALERAGKPVTAVLELDGDWRRADVSWRKSVRIRATVGGNLSRFLTPLSEGDKKNVGIPGQDIAFRLAESKGEADAAGLRKGDIILAFDGKRQLPYRHPQYYWYIEHASGDKMEVTYLRDGKEATTTVVLP